MAFTQFFVLAIAAILVPSILGMEFMVGDDKGWTNNFDYQAWAKGKEFHVGDKLDLQTVGSAIELLLQNKERSSVLQKELRRQPDCPQIYFNRFLIGDRRNQLFGAVFKYPEGAHSVIKVNGTSFQQCAISAANGTLTSGNDVITLATPGNKWYICGIAKHCEVGNQKLFITVSENSSSAARGSIAPMYYGWMMAIFGILMMAMV